MSLADILNSALPILVGFGSSAGFVLVVFIGFCVIVGFTKTKITAGKGRVVKSLEEALSHQAVHYFSPTDPRGPADQLKCPELVEAAARK
jgi:hypothetical protein